MTTCGVDDATARKWNLLLRLIGGAFAVSTGVFCLVVLAIPSASGTDPFGIRAAGLQPLTRFLPICGVGCIAAGILLHRQLLRTRWFFQKQGRQRISVLLVIVMIRCMFLQAGVIPGIFYFILTGSTEWVLVLGCAGIVLMLTGCRGEHECFKGS